MCGVVGIVSTEPVAQALYNALTVLQHRGQDAAGIVTWGEEFGLKQRKSNGLVRDVFRQRHMINLTGHVGIGHVRYPIPPPGRGWLSRGSASSPRSQTRCG